MLKVKADIRHTERLNHHSLGDLDQHPHHKSVNCHNLAWILALFDDVLKCDVAKEYTK